MRIHGEQGHLTENDLALHELTWFLYIFPSGMTVSLAGSQSVSQSVSLAVSLAVSESVNQSVKLYLNSKFHQYTNWFS